MNTVDSINERLLVYDCMVCEYRCMQTQTEADTKHNYLLFEYLLQMYLVPPEHIHPKLWRGFNPRFKPSDTVQIERKHLDKERTLEEHQKLVKKKKILKRDLKRRKKIQAVGMDYESPEIMGSVQLVPKKIKFKD